MTTDSPRESHRGAHHPLTVPTHSYILNSGIVIKDSGHEGGAMLAQYLSNHIAKLGITPAKAARRSRISSTLMHNLLVGNHQVPRPATMEKISTGLGLPLLSLYQQAGVPLPSPQSAAASSAWLRLAEGLSLDPDQEAWLAKVEQE